MDAKPLRLLLIEDNEDDALLLLRTLRREGFAITHLRVETASAMSQALDNQPWDAIVSDYSLPTFSAPEALSLARSRTFDNPFIVVSGAVGEETAAALMKKGAHDFVAKGNLARIGPAMTRELAEAEERRQRRRAEAERGELQSQLIQAQKMEAIGVLTAGVAHDFNNLLGAIQIYLDLAQMKIDQGTPIENELRQIMAVTDRAAGLIRQLMLFSSKQPMALVPFDLNATTSALIKMLGRFIGERVAVETDLAPDLPPAQGDVGGIEQVIMNLAVNARDAMPGGGTLRISTRAVELTEPESRKWPAGRPGSFAVLVIQDTGTGMDAETARRIFEPFFTTKAAGKGTGLGLSVVYGIVAQHHGWIHLDSKPGSGTRFEIYLPVAAGRTEEAPKTEDTLAQFRGAGERILLVEDEEGIRAVTAEGLRALGYLVDEAAGVTDARKLTANAPGRYALAIIDVVLTDGDGFDLALEFSASHPELRLLLTTGYTDEHSRLPAIREYNLPFLAKPFSFSGLLVSLRGLLDVPAGPGKTSDR
jgi:signal transduction histidine kinase